jgi:uncharacterized protein (TIGR03435 family)
VRWLPKADVIGQQVPQTTSEAHTEGFAITAKAADGASPGRMLLMVRSLIAERFQLKVHR